MSLPVFYCHGLPGAPAETALGGGNVPAWTCANLFACRSTQLLEDLLVQFDAHVLVAGPTRLCGFSLGAMAALHIAAARPGDVAEVHLIAPAAPLQLGNFLPRMAGAQVFRVARSRRRLRFLLAMQAAAVRLSPAIVLHAMFSTASDGERALVREGQTTVVLKSALRAALISNRGRYATWLQHYVGDWRDVLGRVRCPVTIWQGGGDAWVPRDMADALAGALPDATVILRENEGHYGALIGYLRDAQKKGRAQGSAEVQQGGEGALTCRPSTD